MSKKACAEDHNWSVLLKRFTLLIIILLCSHLYMHKYLSGWYSVINDSSYYIVSSSKLFSNVRLPLSTKSPENMLKTVNHNEVDVALGSRYPDIVTSISVISWTNSSSYDVAIAAGITSAHYAANTSMATMREEFPIFKTFIPSFCKTYSTGYHYHFYLAYDYVDSLFSTAVYRQRFIDVFVDMVKGFCIYHEASISLVLIQCYHTKHPAWAQNDAVMMAYLQNRDYFYRVNDDTKLITKGWTEIFIEALGQFNPPNVGTVGPFVHRGYMPILTYEFTHHTHQDIFGFHYPRIFTDWTGDHWITGVYKPNRVKMIRKVELTHTRSLGRRYEKHQKVHLLGKRFEQDRKNINRYIKHVRKTIRVMKDPSKVIAFSVYGSNPNISMGAVRNVQLANMVFPEWTVKVYTPLNGKFTTSPLFLDKLVSLGANVMYVDMPLPGTIAIQGALTLEAFKNTNGTVLLRNSEHRLDVRQKKAVDEWMNSPAEFHCIRDHPSHANDTFVPGLYGVKMNGTGLYSDLYDWTLKNRGKPIELKLWRDFQTKYLCHDSVSTITRQSSIRFSKGKRRHYIGQMWDSNMDPIVK